MSSLKTTHRWAVAQQNPEFEKELSAGLGIPGLVARIMVAHGITSIEEGQLFLTPSLDRDWADPLVIPGMSVVADRVERAIRNHEHIAVFGDFDVDGITSTCLLTEALHTFGADVTPFIPHRFDEGYGLSRAALDRVNELARPQLIVTVDNGIAAKEEVSYLESLGIDLVVTDHHEPSDQVPQGVPLTDPKLEDEGPSRELAGAGVALKLVQVLGERLGKPSYWRSLIEVAALGTVSDMMPLTPENRALVAEGIQQMRVTARPGYIALAALAKADLSSITADGLSFSLIPRLNAAGRMADPKLALDLLLARDPIEASALAAELEEINRQRREIEAELTRDAMAKVEKTYDGGRAIVVGGEGWHEGVKGIVASRLTNRYHVPALLFSIEDGIARGSGRSVGKVNLFDAVERCSDLLIRRGGHAGAVGVTIEASKLDEFRRRLSAVLSELPAEDFEDTDEVAATVDLSELNIETIEQISRLEPFGQGNKVPLLAAEGVTMCDRAVVGKTGEHMRFVATDGAASVPAIMFRVPQIDKLINCDSAVDLVFEAVADKYVSQVFNFPHTRVIECNKHYAQGKNPSQIELLLVGEPLGEEVIENARTQMRNFGLEKAELVVRQANTEDKVDVASLQKSYQELLEEKNRRISEMSSQLKRYRVTNVEVNDISREVGAMMDNIGAISLTKGITFDVEGTPGDTTLVCVVTPRDSALPVDRETLTRWLKIRTKVENVKLFVEP